MTAQERIAALSTPTWTLAALAASVESGLVAALDEPREVGELAERTGLPVAVAAALVDVLATMELAERIGEHWVAGAELEPVMREPRLGAAARRPAHDPAAGPRPRHRRRASSRTRSAAGATPTRTCSRRRGGSRRA